MQSDVAGKSRGETGKNSDTGAKGEEVYVRLLADTVSRVGDPTLLDDVEELRRTIDTFRTHRGTQDYVSTMRIVAIVLASTMGFVVTDSSTGMLSDDDETLDYGHGIGAAVHARREWMWGFRRNATGIAARRAASVAFVVGALLDSDMITWAVEFSVAIAEDWSRIAFDVMPEDRKKMALSVFFGDEAPGFAMRLVEAQAKLDALYRAKSKDRCDDEECTCGCPWLRLTAARTRIVYSACLMTAVTGKGCDNYALFEA